MIPIAIFVIIWLVFVGIFMVMAILSIMQMLRFGVRDPLTTWSVIIFVGLSLLIILGTLLFLSQVDLQSGLDLAPVLQNVFPTL